MKLALTIIGLSLAAVALAFAVQGNDFALYRTFAPKYEQVRRDTFKQSQAYNDGMAQELDNMRLEYIRATPDQQQAMASVILHRAASYDASKLPPDLAAFVASLKNAR